MPTRSSDAENVQLVTVGIGLQPGRQASARAISEIRPADRVFVLADAFALDWVRRLNANCRDLTGSYDDAQARAEGFGTDMEPGISAEACLYADLDLDPGRTRRSVVRGQTVPDSAADDRSGRSVAAVADFAGGNVACTGFEARRERIEVLVDKLLNWYPPGTEAILYEAATLPIQDLRVVRVTLLSLPDARLNPATTPLIPPATSAAPDHETLRRLADFE